jgi:hypothetical protein
MASIWCFPFVFSFGLARVKGFNVLVGVVPIATSSTQRRYPQPAHGSGADGVGGGGRSVAVTTIGRQFPAPVGHVKDIDQRINFHFAPHLDHLDLFKLFSALQIIHFAFLLHTMDHCPIGKIHTMLWDQFLLPLASWSFHVHSKAPHTYSLFSVELRANAEIRLFALPCLHGMVLVLWSLALE